MATGDRFEWNMAGLIELSNDALQAWVMPIAGQVERAAIAAAPEVSGEYKRHFYIESGPRTGEDDFAHAYVMNDSPYAAKVEARSGIMGRALNSVEG